MYKYIYIYIYLYIMLLLFSFCWKGTRWLWDRESSPAEYPSACPHGDVLPLCPAALVASWPLWSRTKRTDRIRRAKTVGSWGDTYLATRPHQHTARLDHLLHLHFSLISGNWSSNNHTTMKCAYIYTYLAKSSVAAPGPTVSKARTMAVRPSSPSSTGSSIKRVRWRMVARLAIVGRLCSISLWREEGRSE